MPLKFLTTLDGRNIPIDDIDIRTTIADFGLPPADIAAMVYDAKHGRKEVKREQVTASQAGSGARLLFLEETVDYAIDPNRLVAAHLGTMKHSAINVAHEGLCVEQRVVSKCGRFSAKYDSFVPETGVLRDGKYPDVFKVLMILKGGVEKQARDYVLQLNLAAIILREQGHKVNEMWLDFRPTGAGVQERGELESKYGITGKPPYIPISVPFLPAAEVLAEFSSLADAKARAHKTGEVPPMCTAAQTWGGKRCTQGWCAVAKACAEIAAARGEKHPLNKAVA